MYVKPQSILPFRKIIYFRTHLPITVKFIFKFLVGELRKSTRHRYIPSSDSLMLSTLSWAGWLAVLKNARCANIVGDDHNFAWPNWRPRTSKLNKKNLNKKEFANQQRLCGFCYFFLCVYISRTCRVVLHLLHETIKPSQQHRHVPVALCHMVTLPVWLTLPARPLSVLLN